MDAPGSILFIMMITNVIEDPLPVWGIKGGFGGLRYGVSPCLDCG
jgi:hypothetical protein